MQSRRSFLGMVMAAAAGMGLVRIARAVQPKPVPRKVTDDDRPIHYGELPPILGVPGETFFTTPGTEPPLNARVYFNGKDVHHLCSDADLVGGWVRLYPVIGKDKNGRDEIGYPAYIAWGRVELRPLERESVQIVRTATVKGLGPIRVHV